MRSFYNDGSDEYKLQNEFTAYLQTAIRRVKVRYLNKKSFISATEIPSSAKENSGGLNELGDAAVSFMSNPVFSAPTEEQIDMEIVLAEMLVQLTDRDRVILKRKIVDELSFVEIAALMDMEVNTVKTIYYRAIKKLRALFEA